MSSKNELTLAESNEITSSDNELTIIDEIKKNPASVGENRIPISQVIGRGLSSKEDSFGGRSLIENSKLVDQALNNTYELQDILNHSHSQWVWKQVVIGWMSPYANVRQVAAEMQRKRAALNDAKWRQIRNELKIKRYEEQLQDESIDYWREMELKLRLCELKEGQREGVSYIEGAMKDVLALNEIYEQLKDQIEAFNETEWNATEAKSNLKRSIMQCIRDVRQFSSITKGEQEYLEQVGVNPSKMLLLLRKYVEEEKDDEWDTGKLFDFVEEVANDLINNKKVDIVRLSKLGFDPAPNPDFDYNRKRIGKKDDV